MGFWSLVGFGVFNFDFVLKVVFDLCISVLGEMQWVVLVWCSGEWLGYLYVIR